MKKTLGNAMTKPGTRANVDIVRLGINGEGVGYLKRQVVFVEGALPGERVKVEALLVKEKYAKARIVEIINYSKERVRSDCSIYRACGGCSLQHYNYEAQLKSKREIVEEAFEKYLGKEFPRPEIKPTLGMKQPWYYRNKAQIPLVKRDNKVIAGLYQPGSNKIIEMKKCKVHHPDLDKVVHGIKELVEELKIPIYDNKSRKGHLRNIVVRIAFATGEMQVVLVTVGEELSQAKELIKRIPLKCPKVISIAQNINSSKTPLVMGDKSKVLWGQERLIETVGKVKYGLSPRAFFQLNPIQMEVLYNEVKKAAKLTGTEKVLDAYCGAGTIGLWLAGEAEEIRGIESIGDAVTDAKFNAELNEVENTHFSVGNVERLLPKWIKNGYKPDVIVVDPPRTGCEDKMLEAICKAKPDRIVYVSCNPATLAKDCKVLLGRGYRIEYVQPVDMFPMTGHVECAILMTKCGCEEEK